MTAISIVVPVLDEAARLAALCPDAPAFRETMAAS